MTGYSQERTICSFMKCLIEQVIRIARRKELKPELNAITQQEPSKSFLLSKIEEQRRENEEQRGKIDSLISICHDQSRSIKQLKELCNNQQQEMRNGFREMQNKFSALREDVNNKFNSLVNIINENDIF